jgi:hypothetical protein
MKAMKAMKAMMKAMMKSIKERPAAAARPLPLIEVSGDRGPEFLNANFIVSVRLGRAEDDPAALAIAETLLSTGHCRRYIGEDAERIAESLGVEIPREMFRRQQRDPHPGRNGKVFSAFLAEQNGDDG